MTLLSNLSEAASKNFMTIKNYLYKHYGEEPGKMLVHTGVLSWTLSAAAQVMAVAFNDKISKKEKLFLIPQECADAAINILSFYLVTNAFTNLGVKLVKTGKLTTPLIDKFIKKNKVQNVGKITTDISKNMSGEVLDEFKSLKSGVSMITNTIGSIASCNILTPILRNEYAARKQKEILSKDRSPKIVSKNSKIQLIKPLSMEAYQKLAYMKFSGNNLKI